MKNMPTHVNKPKELLKDGKPVKIFTVFESLRPAIVKIVAQVGYDIIMIDTEHVLHDNETLTNFLVMARDNGLYPMVTVPSPERHIVSRILDAGAMGIILSHSKTIEDVEELVRWAKYPPVGKRALALGANAGYTEEKASIYCEQANNEIMLFLKIEEYEGVQNAEDMMANKSVDGIVFGPGDLAADMGFHGQWEHPEVLKAIESVIEQSIGRNIAVESAIATTDRLDYQRQRARGIQIFGPTRQSEWDLLRDAAYRVIGQLREP